MDNQDQCLLVSPDWLYGSLSDESLLVLDVRPSRGSSAYRQGHIPGALPFALPYVLGTVNGTPNCLLEEAMARQLSALGVHRDQTVVLYDDGYSTVLAQSFWAFERLGQREVRVLDGGFNAWLASGAPVDDRLPARAGSSYSPQPQETCSATPEWITAHQHTAQILDARSLQEWCAAHIPGAKSCCWTRFLDGETDPPTLLPLEQIINALEADSLSPDQETVTYCRTGARASFVYFVLRLAGWTRVRNYEGSLTDWLLREQPVERC